MGPFPYNMAAASQAEFDGILQESGASGIEYGTFYTDWLTCRQYAARRLIVYWNEPDGHVWRL